MDDSRCHIRLAASKNMMFLFLAIARSRSWGKPEVSDRITHENNLLSFGLGSWIKAILEHAKEVKFFLQNLPQTGIENVPHVRSTKHLQIWIFINTLYRLSASPLLPFPSTIIIQLWKCEILRIAKRRSWVTKQQNKYTCCRTSFHIGDWWYEWGFVFYFCTGR